MTEYTSQNADGWLRLAYKIHGLGLTDYKKHLAEITNSIIQHLCKEGYSADFVKREVIFFARCYLSVVSEAGSRALSEPTLH